MSPYITFTDNQLTTELERLQTEYGDAVTRWSAGDTSAETSKARIAAQMQEVTEEVSQRPTLYTLIRRIPRTRTVAAFS